MFTCAFVSSFDDLLTQKTSDIRLQLLEPERHPYLFKCLYGILMLLPQSSAFVSLRNRLNAVNSTGFLHIAPKSTPNVSSTRSRIGRDEIKWQELLTHFRSTQMRHEKARRQAIGEGDNASTPGYFDRDRDLDLSVLHLNQREIVGDNRSGLARPAVVFFQSLHYFYLQYHSFR